MFLLKGSQVYSRGATLAFDVVALPLLLSLRVAVATTLERLMARQAVRGDPAIVLGIPDELARLSSRDLLQNYGSCEVGRFELPLGIRRDRNITNATIDAARKLEATKVFLAVPWDDLNRRQLVSERLRSVPVAVILLPDRSVGPILSQAKLGPNSEIQIEIQRAPLSPTERTSGQARMRCSSCRNNSPPARTADDRYQRYDRSRF